MSGNREFVFKKSPENVLKMSCNHKLLTFKLSQFMASVLRVKKKKLVFHKYVIIKLIGIMWIFLKTRQKALSPEMQG